jgi:hypothetical protein
MLVMPNFDDPVFDEVRRGPGGKSRSKPKPRTSQRAKRGKAAKGTGGARPKRSQARSSR